MIFRGLMMMTLVMGIGADGATKKRVPSKRPTKATTSAKPQLSRPATAVPETSGEPNGGSSSEEENTKTAKAQAGVVGVDGATVYAQSDFDAKVVAVLQPGMKVTVSQRKFPGLGGLGAFYRIRFGPEKFGYVADTEVIPEFQKVGKKKKKNPFFEDVEELRERALSGRESIYLTRYLGLQVGQLQFTERFQGRSLSDEVMMYGVKATGPGVLFDGPPLDFTFSFSPTPPDYYNITGRPPSGFFVFSDLSMLVGIVDKPNFAIYAGLGLMLTYTKFRVQTALDFRDISELRLGAVGEVGMAYRWRKWVGRADAKYYYEKRTYLGYWLSLQHEY